MIKRILLSLTLLAFVAIALGALTWQQWIFPVTASVLAKHQVELIAADIQRPGLQGITVKNLELKYSGASNTLSLQSPLLLIGYELGSLVNGKLESLSTTELSVTISKSPSEITERAGAHSSSLPILLPSQAFELIPVDYINIDRLVLEIPEQPDFQRFSGNIRLANGQLSATLQNTQKTNLQLRLSASQNDAMNFDLRMAETELLVIDGKVIDNQFTGAFHAELAGISELTDRFSITPPDYRLNGTANINWSMPLAKSAQSIDISDLGAVGSIEVKAQTDFPGKSTSASATIYSTFATEKNELIFSLETFESAAQLQLPKTLDNTFPQKPPTPLEIGIGLVEPATLAYNVENQTLDTNNTKLLAKLSHQQSGFDGSVELMPKSFAHGQNPNTATDFKLDANLAKFSSASLTAEATKIIAQGSIEGVENSLRMSISPGGHLKTQSINAGELNITDPRISLRDELVVELTAEALRTQAAQLQFNSAAISIGNQPITYSSLEFKLEPSSLLFSDNRLKTALSGQLQALALVWQDYQIVPINLDGKIDLLNNDLAGVFSLSDQHQLLQTEGNFTFNLADASGELNAETQSVTFNESDAFLPKLISPAVVPLDFTAGSFNANTKLTTSPQGTNSHTDVVFKGMDGFYDTNFFYALNGSLRITDLHNQPVIQSELLQIDKVNVGTELTELAFSLVPLKSGIELADFRAGIFGGHITQDQIVYEWDQPENYIVLNLHKLQLNEILQLESGISGSGTLGGVIPIIISQKGISVRKGGVSAQAPGGIIRYDTEVPLNPTAANAGLKLTLDALKNFHYTSLSTEIEYSYEGDLLLKASLQGRNPDLDETRPFHFNLNITENIPTLLKALRFSQQLNDDLSQRINDFYSTNSQESTQ